MRRAEQAEQASVTSEANNQSCDLQPCSQRRHSLGRKRGSDGRVPAQGQSSHQRQRDRSCLIPSMMADTELGSDRSIRVRPVLYMEHTELRVNLAASAARVRARKLGMF